MSSIKKFDIDGTPYNLARDILMKFADTMLSKSVPEKWSKGKNQEPLFIDRNGENF